MRKKWIQLGLVLLALTCQSVHASHGSNTPAPGQISSFTSHGTVAAFILNPGLRRPYPNATIAFNHNAIEGLLSDSLVGFTSQGVDLFGGKGDDVIHLSLSPGVTDYFPLRGSSGRRTGIFCLSETLSCQTFAFDVVQSLFATGSIGVEQRTLTELGTLSDTISQLETLAAGQASLNASHSKLWVPLTGANRIASCGSKRCDMIEVSATIQSPQSVAYVPQGDLGNDTIEGDLGNDTIVIMSGVGGTAEVFTTCLVADGSLNSCTSSNNTSFTFFDPTGMAVSQNANFVYVADSGNGVAGSSRVAVCPLSRGLDGIAIVGDCADAAAELGITLSRAVGIAVGSQSRQVYVTDKAADTVKVFGVDAKTGVFTSLSGTFATGSAPMGITLNAAGTEAYVVSTGLGKIERYAIESDRSATLLDSFPSAASWALLD